jgi:hypothetical protein
MNETATKRSEVSTRSVVIVVPGDALAMINVGWQESQTRSDAAVSLHPIGMQIRKQPHFAAKPW